jgi:hypothetical protein
MSAPDLPERLRAAAALLEAIARDRTLLEVLTPGDRERLMRAVAGVYNPDPVARRRRLKAAERERSAARTARDEAALHQTGIRVLRAKPVLTTPNVFPPSLEAAERPEIEESAGERHCYVCKQKITAIHRFYDQMCLPCAELNFAKRSELADLKGRVALLTGGRVKIGYQAGLKLLAAARTSSSPRASRATRPGATRRSLISASGATAWRSSAWTCAIRRASRRSAARCSPRASGSTSSSTTPARPCAGRRSSTPT